jgi:hypothetical protein
MIRLLIAAALALIAGAAAAPAGAPRLELDARLVWRDSVAGFGSFSGLEVLDGGSRFVAITDKGHWATGTMDRDGDRLTGVRLTGFGRLLGVNGQPLAGEDIDAEGLAIDARGRFWISFEAFHRIRRYDRIDGPATHVDGHPDFPDLQNNSALEALAIDATGTLYAIPERSGVLDRPFPVFRLRDGRWDRDLRLPRTGAFLVSGADFGPDGRLYLLERDFRWLGGFATRVRHFTLGPQGFDDGTTLLETTFGELDNMEAISVWRDSAGRTRVTLLSDDNWFPLQRTLFAEFLLVETEH